MFKKQDGRWLLVSHITSVMPQYDPSEPRPPSGEADWGGLYAEAAVETVWTVEGR